MRGLVSALVLVPALALEIVQRNPERKWEKEHKAVSYSETGYYILDDAGRSTSTTDSISAVGHSTIKVPNQSPDDAFEGETIGVKLEVLSSDAACGYGNITIDGQVLPQTFNDGLSSGKGSVTTERQSIVLASWDFYCVTVDGLLDPQLLKFVVETVDGKAVQDAGFAILFRQTGTPEILSVDDLSSPVRIISNPDPELLQLVDDDENFPDFNIEEEMAELEYLWAQMRELKFLIHEKERVIAHQTHKHLASEGFGDCDSLKCIAKAVAKEAKQAIHSLYGKIRGDEDFDVFDDPHFKKPKFPKFPKNPFKHWPKKNCTHGPPKHGNLTHPPKGNHTHPPHPPHFKKPKLPLPICRYPPPPLNGDKHPPEFDRLSLHHHESPPDFDRPPRNHINGPHDRPHVFDGPPSKHHGDGPNDGPDFDSSLDFDSPPLPPHHRDGSPPLHRGGYHGPRPGGPEDEQERIHSGNFKGPLFPHHRSPSHKGVARALHLLKFSAVGFIFAFLVIALHRRIYYPRSRASHQARREDRHRRRAYRRAAHKHIITRILARMSGHGSDDESDDEWEEKRAAVLLANAEDGMSTTMTEEITELRNAAEVIGEIAAAEEASVHIPTIMESMSIPASENRPLPGDFDMSSQVGDGEELPAYEDNNGSETSSVVADRFRYTLGSLTYSPSHSPSGSVSDILGVDTKS